MAFQFADTFAAPDAQLMPPQSKAAAGPPPRRPDAPRLRAPVQVSDLMPKLIAQPPLGVQHPDIPRVSDLHVQPSFALPLPDPPPTVPAFVLDSSPLEKPSLNRHVSSSLCRSDQIPAILLQTHSSSAGQANFHVPALRMPGLTACTPGKRPAQTAAQQILRVRHASASPLLLAKWMHLLEQLQDFSNLWQSISTSTNKDVHAARVLDGVAPSTALKYISTCLTFLTTLNSLRISLKGLTVVADVLLTMSLAKSSSTVGGSCISSIKALRWLHRIADAPALSAIHTPLVQSFLVRRIPRDRKEAPPLPLWVLTQWERRILMSSCPALQVIILGSFLLMAWASLRFSDAQRVDLNKLVFSDHDLRGLVWRSKTSIIGVPFGI